MVHRTESLEHGSWGTRLGTGKLPETKLSLPLYLFFRGSMVFRFVLTESVWFILFCLLSLSPILLSIHKAWLAWPYLIPNFHKRRSDWPSLARYLSLDQWNVIREWNQWECVYGNYSHRKGQVSEDNLKGVSYSHILLIFTVKTYQEKNHQKIN